MSIAVMTYNIRTGGAGRLDGLLRVITGVRPDLLALQELRGFDVDGFQRLHELADGLGMRAFPARSTRGQPVAVLVTAGARVRAGEAVERGLHHGAVRVVVDTDRGPLTLVGTHLCPFSGRRRLHEARRLRARLDPGTAGLLAGDLNTLDPWTGHGERLGRLPLRYRRRHLRGGIGRTVDTRAIAELDRAGLVDLYRLVGARPGAPGPGAAEGRDDGHTAPTRYGGGPEFAGMRLDYVFATPAAAALARSARVVRGGDAEWASDHYPLVVELDATLN
jgi:exodeoxyribonuclease III